MRASRIMDEFRVRTSHSRNAKLAWPSAGAWHFTRTKHAFPTINLWYLPISRAIETQLDFHLYSLAIIVGICHSSWLPPALARRAQRKPHLQLEQLRLNSNTLLESASQRQANGSSVCSSWSVYMQVRYLLAGFRAITRRSESRAERDRCICCLPANRLHYLAGAIHCVWLLLDHD